VGCFVAKKNDRLAKFDPTHKPVLKHTQQQQKKKHHSIKLALILSDNGSTYNYCNETITHKFESNI
jgi:YHS domain-containing protein